MNNSSFSRKQKRRLFAVLIPAKSGKTYLHEKIGEYVSKGEKEHNFIDVDGLADHIIKYEFKNDYSLVRSKSLKETQLFPQLREAVGKTFQGRLNATIVLITSNVNLIKFLGIKDKRIFRAVPSQKFLEELNKGVDPNTRAIVAQTRDQIMKNCKTAHVFDNLVDLLKITVEFFKLVKGV